MNAGSSDIGATNAAFARGMRLAREKRCLSIRQMALAVNAHGGGDLHYSVIYQMEAGQRKVSIGEAVAISSVFGVNIARIIAAGRGAA